jgi:hypothetical protein
MKNTYIIVANFIFAAGAFAETRFPRGSFEAADLEKAKALATTQKKEISFIYTDKKSIVAYVRTLPPHTSVRSSRRQ